METSRNMEGQEMVDSSSLPSVAWKPPANDEPVVPKCPECGWMPDQKTERPFAKLRSAVDKHFKRNHKSRDHLCPACPQSFKNRPDNVKPHVKRKHPEVFARLYGQTRPPKLRKNVLPPDPISANTKPPESQVKRMWRDGSLPGRAVPGTAAQESRETELTRDRPVAPPLEKSSWTPYFISMASKKESCYSYLSQVSNCPTKSTTWSSLDFEMSEQSQLAEMLDHSNLTNANFPEYMGPESDGLLLSGNETKTEIRKTVGSSSFYGDVSPQAHEHSNDELSSRPSETSTPDSSSFWLPECSKDEEERLPLSHPFMHFKAAAAVIALKAFVAWKQYNLPGNSPSDQDGQSHAARETNDASNRDKGKGKGTPKRKPTSEDASEIDRGATEGNEPSSSQTISNKRRRTSDRKLTFACPYTKKDSMSYRDCYKYTLSRIRDVKQHLARRHQKPLYCPRCMITFEDEGERDGHSREPVPCPVRPTIALDGITESQRHRLAKKSASNTSEEAQWFAVFDILFPGHSPRPESPYIDRELLQDITLYQDFLTTNGPRILSEVLARRGAITWNLPDEERDLAAFQQTVFEEGLHVIFNQWVLGRSRSTVHMSLPPSSGIASNPTPPSSEATPLAERVGPSSSQAPGVPSTIPGREPTSLILDTDVVQGASPSQSLFAEGLTEIFNFGQEGLDFIQGLSYDDPDEELRSLMLAPQARLPFPPAPG